MAGAGAGVGTTAAAAAGTAVASGAAAEEGATVTATETAGAATGTTEVGCVAPSPASVGMTGSGGESRASRSWPQPSALRGERSVDANESIGDAPHCVIRACIHSHDGPCRSTSPLALFGDPNGSERGAGMRAVGGERRAIVASGSRDEKHVCRARDRRRTRPYRWEISDTRRDMNSRASSSRDCVMGPVTKHRSVFSSPPRIVSFLICVSLANSPDQCAELNPP